MCLLLNQWGFRGQLLSPAGPHSLALFSWLSTRCTCCGCPTQCGCTPVHMALMPEYPSAATSVVMCRMSLTTSSTEGFHQISQLAHPWLLPPTCAEIYGWLPIQKDPLSQWADRPNIWRCLESWTPKGWNLLPDPQAAHRQPHQVRVAHSPWPKCTRLSWAKQISSVCATSDLFPPGSLLVQIQWRERLGAVVVVYRPFPSE